MQDALFDGVLRDDLVDAHHLRLADAVRAVGGLVLRGGVPPGVGVHHHRRAGEVESGARCV